LVIIIIKKQYIKKIEKIKIKKKKKKLTAERGRERLMN